MQVNVGVIGRCVDGSLKPKRGKTLPVAVHPQCSAKELLQAAQRKLKSFNKDMREGPYILLYPDGSEANTIPGSEKPFTVAQYKTEIGKPYHRITLFLCLQEDFERQGLFFPKYLHLYMEIIFGGYFIVLGAGTFCSLNTTIIIF